jgi:alanine racemase
MPVMSVHNPPETQAGAILTVDLDAIAANWRLLRDAADGAETAAVVKADAYGTGIDKVAPRLWDEGCRHYFVAHLSEGVDLRAVLPAEATIHILNGLLPGGTALYAEHDLVPALGSLDEIDRWIAHCSASPLPCNIHVDTGMLRLGLPPDELDILAADGSRLGKLDVQLVMSHFASADEEDDGQNQKQIAAFQRARAMLPMGRASFANSAGILRGPAYRGDLVRPGIALYGSNPTPWVENRMHPAVTLETRILQVRDARPGDTVSYGATYTVEKPMRIATVSVGYADGYLRSLTGGGRAFIGNQAVPILGRVTMDLTMLDVTDIDPAKCRPGDLVELIGPHIGVDEVAARAGTIAHEILTGLGGRYHRRYVGE